MPDITELPHNEDAEKSALGAAFRDLSALDLAMERLSPGDFYIERHRVIFRAMASVYNDTGGVGEIRICDELGEDLERVGGAGYVTGLTTYLPSASNAEHYIRIVAEKSRQRRTIQVLKTRLEEAQSYTVSIDDLTDDTIGDLSDLRLDGEQDTLISAKEAAHETYRMVEAWHEGEEEPAMSTGFSDLDDYFRLRPGALYVIGGRPSMGKSALAQNMMQRQSIRGGHASALFSLEMANRRLALRFMCIEARVNSRVVESQQLGADEWNRLLEGAAEFGQSRIHLDEKAAMPVSEFRAKCRRLKAQDELDVAYIDYLQLMRPSTSCRSKEQEIADISGNLKRIAKELEIPVVALAQLNRGVERREDKRPRMSDLRYSGAIEQDADVIAFLYRDEFYYEDSDRKGIADVLIRKNRSGETGTVSLSWQPHFTRFDDLAKQYD